MHLFSGIDGLRSASSGARRAASPSLAKAARRGAGVLLCALAIFAAGCHRNNLTSGYGQVWVTLTDEPGDFPSFIVDVDSVTLTRNDGYVATALATVEQVDFAKLNNISELWGTGTVPTGTYVSAQFVVDFTSAFITVMVNGLPVQARVIDENAAAVGQVTINVNFDTVDAANQLIIPPTYATTAAQRLAFDLNLALSVEAISLAGPQPTVQIRPYMTAAIAPADNKPIRVRGPLINSNVDLGTYTVYERPFYDEQNNFGSLTLFTTPSTIFSINGTVAQGTPGITQLSQSSAGSTVTAAYTTYQPTATPTATAGIFTALYVVAGSTLEDVYTQGLEGDVVARNGNTLTVRGSTLFLNDGTSTYNVADAQVLIGTQTLVTADNSLATGLTYNSVAVGQHIIVRGIYSLSGTTVVIDATGASSTNTGSVRLISTQLWGSVVSGATGNIVLDLKNINNWPATEYAFAGNGSSAAATPVPNAFYVNTGTLPLPGVIPGNPLWIDGVFAPFGSAPPDFNATSVNDEFTVQIAGAPAGGQTCGQGNFDCVAASMRVNWTLPGMVANPPGTHTPFVGLTTDRLSGFSVDLTNLNYVSGEIRIGPEAIDLKSLPASPQIIPAATPASVTTNTNSPGSIPVTIPPVFLPQFSFGDPTTVAPGGVSTYNVFSTYATYLNNVLPSVSALQFEARGTYVRSTNTFYAISLNVVL